MNKSDIAIKKFGEGNYNCSQSVLFSFSKDLGLDEKLALKIATGFGVGMGRNQTVCGAVSGAVMVISLKYGNNMELTYTNVRNFIRKFKEKTATIECIDLLDGCNLLTENGQKYFRENGFRQKKCSEYIKLSCEILEEITSEQS